MMSRQDQPCSYHHMETKLSEDQLKSSSLIDT